MFSGDSMYYNNGYQFSTPDRDNDVWSGYNCADVLGGVGGGIWAAPMPI